MQRRVCAAKWRDSLLSTVAQNDRYRIIIKKNAHPNRDERDARGTTLIPALAFYNSQALSRVRPSGLYSRPGNDGRLRLSYFVEQNGILFYSSDRSSRRIFNPFG